MGRNGFRRDVGNDKLDIETGGTRRVGFVNDEALPRATLGSTKGTVIAADSQSIGPSAADIKTGLIVHTSVTGAGTITVPTGTQMEDEFPGLEVGDTIECYYLNDGNQTVTLTGDTGTTMLSAQTVATLQGRLLVFMKTGDNTFNVFGV